jgi:hypothetical protein
MLVCTMIVLDEIMACHETWYAYYTTEDHPTVVVLNFLQSITRS